MPEDEAIAFDIRTLSPIGVQGSIRLHVSRFLHVTVDLSYRPPGGYTVSMPDARLERLEPFSPLEPANPFDPAPGLLTELKLGPAYNLKAERRILRGELNYLDHPAFGLVIVITLEPELQLPPDDSGDRSRPAA